MRLNCQFKGLHVSQSLQSYAAEQIDQKLAKYEFKPLKVNLTFTKQRHLVTAELYVLGQRFSFRAQAKNPDFETAFDSALVKLGRQLAKTKGKVQHHKSFEKSAYGKVRQLNPQLEYSYEPVKKRAV